MIAKKIKNMKDNKSPEFDGIKPKLIKEIVEQINTTLAKVFNLSQVEGIVPFEWKEANIVPLFKKGSPVNVAYLNFQKALDKVLHQTLLLKLKAHGIGNDVINWIKKRLAGRRKRVIVDGKVSN